MRAVYIILGLLALQAVVTNADSVGTGVADPVVDKASIGLNLLWIVVGASMVMFMQAGFAMVETGLCRAKHAVHVVATNFAIFSLAFVAFLIFGFPWAFGGFSYSAFGMTAPGKAAIGSGDSVFLWTGGYFLSGDAYDYATCAFFLYMAAFMDTTATIPTGSMAERWKWSAFIVWGLFCGAWYYPMIAGFTWGGGWMSQLGNSRNLGHGYVDFAGSGVVHTSGGIAALVGAYLLGPRLRRFGKDALPAAAFAPHNVPLVALGCFILMFGWFGFNAASTFAATDLRFPVAAVNTAIGGAFGGFAVIFYAPVRLGRNDFIFMVNGLLAGLVAVTGPCAFIAPWAAAVIGLLAGLLATEVALLVEKVELDDPVGAIAVHLACGVWGVLATGLFADGTYGVGWNNTNTALASGKGVTGLFYNGYLGGRQFVAQLLSAVVIVAWQGAWAFAFFWIQNKVQGIRSSAEDELEGLDATEMSSSAYPEFVHMDQVQRIIKQAVAIALASSSSDLTIKDRGSSTQTAVVMPEAVPAIELAIRS